jgi:hypothetical protein
MNEITAIEKDNTGEENLLATRIDAAPEYVMRKTIRGLASSK